MKNLKKVSRIAKMAFLNALRLHKDSILLYRNGSFPSAYQFSIIAQEEIGKAYLMEEHYFQMGGRSQDIDANLEKMIVDSMLSHKVKQGWFSRQADDFWKYKGKKYPKIIHDISSGQLEENKQNATYVGLTRKAGKVNPRGKIVVPTQKIKSTHAYFMITRVNDFIIDLIEGVRRGFYTADSDALDEALTFDIVDVLEKLWPDKTNAAEAKLRNMRKSEVVND